MAEAITAAKGRRGRPPARRAARAHQGDRDLRGDRRAVPRRDRRRDRRGRPRRLSVPGRADGAAGQSAGQVRSVAAHGIPVHGRGLCSSCRRDGDARVPGPQVRPFVHGLSTRDWRALHPRVTHSRSDFPTASSSLPSPAPTVRVGEPWSKPSTTPAPARSGRPSRRVAGARVPPARPRGRGVPPRGDAALQRRGVGRHRDLLGRATSTSRRTATSSRAIQALMERGEAIDAVTVTDELKRSGLLEQVGDPSIFISLQANTPSIANARHYAQIVEEHALLRTPHRCGRRDRRHRLLGPRGREGGGRRGRADGLQRRRAADGRHHAAAARAARAGPGPDRGAGPARLDTSPAWPRATTSWTGSCSASSRPRLNIVGRPPGMGKTSFALGVLAHVGLEVGRPAPAVLARDGPSRADPAPPGLRGGGQRPEPADRADPGPRTGARSAWP